MAKTVLKKGGSSRIRFVMVDAELGDGDFTAITHVIANALQQAQPARRLISAPVRSEAEPGGNGSGGAEEPEHEAEVEEVEGTEVTPRSTKARKFPTPKAVPDLDPNSGEMSFEEFAKQKGSPDQALKRYLLVAYWCKKYRDIEAVTQDHVYTCYKVTGWGTDIKNFAQPLRDLGRFGRGEFKAGAFTINHVGEALVEKMNAK